MSWLAFHVYMRTSKTWFACWNPLLEKSMLLSKERRFVNHFLVNNNGSRRSIQMHNTKHRYKNGHLKENLPSHEPIPNHGSGSTTPNRNTIEAPKCHLISLDKDKQAPQTIYHHSSKCKASKFTHKARTRQPNPYLMLSRLVKTL